MTDLDTIRATVLTILQDATKIIFTDNDIDVSIDLALLEYSVALPYSIATVLTLARPGPEIDLSSLQQVSSVCRVYYPWDSTLPYNQQRPNAVKAWDFYSNSGSAAILLDTSPVNPDAPAVVPAAGEEIRIHYDTVHSLAGLHGALVTTVPLGHFDLIARGAAGSALLFAAVNRGEVLDSKQAKAVAADHLEVFHTMLNDLHLAAQRTGNILSPWSRMDKFDRVI